VGLWEDLFALEWDGDWRSGSPAFDAFDESAAASAAAAAAAGFWAFCAPEVRFVGTPTGNMPRGTPPNGTVTPNSTPDGRAARAAFVLEKAIGGALDEADAGEPETEETGETAEETAFPL